MHALENNSSVLLTTKTPASCALTSLPWPSQTANIPTLCHETDNILFQAIPLFDPSQPPRLPRYLVLTQSQERNLPSQLKIDTGGEHDPSNRQIEARTLIEIVPQREGTEPYYHREDEARIHLAGRTIGLRLGLELEEAGNTGYSWWQWTRAELLWSGPVADAWRIGGHIPTHSIDNAPTIPADLNMYEAMEQFGGQQIHADVFVILWHCGIVQVTAHFKNNFWMVPAENVPGLPVIAITQLEGDFAEQTLDGTETLIGGSAGDRLDLTDCNTFFDETHRGLVVPRPGNTLLFRPFENIEIVTHKTKENELLCLGEPTQKGLPAGVARSIRFNIGLNDRIPSVARYNVPSTWYGRCGLFNGLAQETVVGSAVEWAGPSRDLTYENLHRGGFDTGRAWRYLRRDLRSGIAQIDDAEWEGGTGQALLVDSYLRPDAADLDLILHQIYHYADIAVHHGHMKVRCHGYNTLHIPLPMMRVGALVYGYAETGDPFLLETAYGVADTFMAMDRSNQPRHSMGRDVYPLAGLMALYDYTGDRRYLDYGRQLVTRLLASQTEFGGFSGQGGVGLLAGNCNKWHPRDITFGSGLLAPIAIWEWALRDDRHPPGFHEQMTQWYELALSLQTPEGYWPQGLVDGNPSYPLIVSGLLLGFSAYHRLYGDSRGLQAIRKYLDYAFREDDWLLGTHSFLALTYAAFYDMEYAAAGNAAHL